MGVLVPGDPQYPGESTLCFWCAESVADGEPVVYWHGGGGGQLWLHGGCVGSFVLRLARDAWEIERDAGDGRFTITLRQEGVKLSAR